MIIDICNAVEDALNKNPEYNKGDFKIDMLAVIESALYSMLGYYGDSLIGKHVVDEDGVERIICGYHDDMYITQEVWRYEDKVWTMHDEFVDKETIFRWISEKNERIEYND